LLRRIGRRLGRWVPESPRSYWRRRAAEFGRRSVLNLAHSEADFETVTLRQKSELYPQLRKLVAGGERRILDFGCGPGRFTADLAALIDGEAVGVDVVERYLELAPEAPTVRYQAMRPGKIPLPDEWADIVWVCLVLGGIDGRPLVRTVAEIERVLAPGGLLFLVENTSEGKGSPRWRFRREEDYRRLFPAIDLAHLYDYFDVGERISVLAGRKAVAG
jgi:SAM-dependent methyltransferase